LAVPVQVELQLVQDAVLAVPVHVELQLLQPVDFAVFEQVELQFKHPADVVVPVQVEPQVELQFKQPAPFAVPEHVELQLEQLVVVVPEQDELQLEHTEDVALDEQLLLQLFGSGLSISGSQLVKKLPSDTKAKNGIVFIPTVLKKLLRPRKFFSFSIFSSSVILLSY